LIASASDMSSPTGSNARAQGRARPNQQSRGCCSARPSAARVLAACLTLPRAYPHRITSLVAQQNRLRNRQSQRLGRIEIDHKLVVGRLLDREVSGSGALKDLIDVARSVPVQRAVSWGRRTSSPRRRDTAWTHRSPAVLASDARSMTFRRCTANSSWARRTAPGRGD